MSEHGVFIEVELDPGIATDGELARKLEEVARSTSSSGENGRVDVVRENLDECVLCELCLDAAPAGKLAIASSTTAPSCGGMSKAGASTPPRAPLVEVTVASVDSTSGNVAFVRAYGALRRAFWV